LEVAMRSCRVSGVITNMVVGHRFRPWRGPGRDDTAPWVVLAPALVLVVAVGAGLSPDFAMGAQKARLQKAEDQLLDAEAALAQVVTQNVTCFGQKSYCWSRPRNAAG